MFRMLPHVVFWAALLIPRWGAMAQPLRIYTGLTTEIRGEELWLANYPNRDGLDETIYIADVTFSSLGSHLIPLPTGAMSPFDVRENTTSRVNLGTLGAPIEMAPRASINTGVRYPLNASGEKDLTATFVSRTGTLVAMGVHDWQHRLFPNDQIFYDIDPSDHSIWIVNRGAPFATNGMSVKSLQGLLVDNPDQASPFQFVLQNTSSELALGSLQPVEFGTNTRTRTAVTYRGTAGSNDLVIYLGNVEGPIQRVPEPEGILLALFALSASSFVRSRNCEGNKTSYLIECRRLLRI